MLVVHPTSGIMEALVHQRRSLILILIHYNADTSYLFVNGK